jgi:NAD(P)H dehydrogenase (quinone)
MIKTEEAPRNWELLDGAGAIIMGAPTYMSSLVRRQIGGIGS